MTSLSSPTKETREQMRALGETHARADHKGDSFCGIDGIRERANAVAREELGVDLGSRGHDFNFLAFMNAYRSPAGKPKALAMG